MLAASIHCGRYNGPLAQVQGSDTQVLATFRLRTPFLRIREHDARMTQPLYHAHMSQTSTTPEERIAAFALDLIEQGRELTERGERMLRVLELCAPGSIERYVSEPASRYGAGLGPPGPER
jgi:hypothetical protein